MTSSFASAQSPRLLFTSFGPFLDVKENPSFKVASALYDSLRAEGYDVRHDAELEVAGAAMAEYFSQLRSSLLKEVISKEALRIGESLDASRPLILIHFGVHPLESIHVELLGQNYIDFSCGDVRGIKASQVPIVSLSNDSREEQRKRGGGFYPNELQEAWGTQVSNLKISFDSDDESEIPPCCQSDLRTGAFSQLSEDWVRSAIESTNSTIEPSAPIQLGVNFNAGRYLCNFTLFSSISLSNEMNRIRNHNGIPHYISLFIHVAPARVLDAVQQSKLILPFIRQLLNTDMVVLTDANN